MIDTEKEATGSVGLCELPQSATTPKLNILRSIIILAHSENNQNTMCINKNHSQVREDHRGLPSVSWTRAKYRHFAEHSHSIITQTMFH